MWDLGQTEPGSAVDLTLIQSGLGVGCSDREESLCLQVSLSRNCSSSPCQVDQQENKSQGILCPARFAQPQTPETVINFKGSKTTPGSQEGKGVGYCNKAEILSGFRQKSREISQIST